MSDAEFFTGLTGGQNDFAQAVAALRATGISVEQFPHSLNALFPGSRLRFQLTLNDRYCQFPSRAVETELFGIRVPVTALEDLVQGKLWAAMDTTRRASKRQKDRLDLTRICEPHPRIIPIIPIGLIPEVDQLRNPS